MDAENLTTLDQDYMTIYSRFLLEGNYSYIETEVIALAEMGQLDAIKLFYEKSNYQSEKVDSYIKELLKKEDRLWTANESEAVAAYYFRQEKDDVLTTIDEYFKLRRLCIAIEKEAEKKSTAWAMTMKEQYNSIKNRMTAYLADYNKFKSTQYKINAQILYGLLGRATDVNDMEKSLELAKEIAGFEFNGKKYEKVVKKYYRHHKDDVLARFCYGKNLCLVQGGDDNHKKGLKILQDIYNRPLSIEVCAQTTLVDDRIRDEYLEAHKSDENRVYEKITPDKVATQQAINDLEK